MSEGTDPTGEAYAAAIEAVARMLPTQMPAGGEYDVARAALTAAAPELLRHLRPYAVREVLLDLAALHTPGTADHDGFTGCQHAWPCTTARLCADALALWPAAEVDRPTPQGIQPGA